LLRAELARPRPISPLQPAPGGVVVEKMHLWALAFEGENSIVAAQ
jgi:hypothetical protein